MPFLRQRHRRRPALLPALRAALRRAAPAIHERHHLHGHDEAAGKSPGRLSPNAALIAGVGTLLLAMGVGVLIGHSGNQSVATNPAPAQVITVHGGGGETENTPTTNQNGASGKGGEKSKKDSASAKKKAETGQGAEEVLKPSAGVKLPPATAEVGSKCVKGAAGCKGGEFTGEFFGE
jgi:hypothetical protein